MFLYPKVARKGNVNNASIAVRAPDIYDVPEELIMFYVDRGEAIVATTSRVYGATAAWRTEYSFGPAIATAIEMPHRWQPDDTGKYKIATYGDPYFIWIKPITAEAGSLHFSRGPALTSTQLVSEGVTQVDAIHGWKNVRRPWDDQGLIVAYIQYGIPYLLSYYELEDGTYSWSDPYALTPSGGEVIKRVQLFRTPDYRTGILMTTTTGQVFLSTTSRTYSGVGVTSPDYISASIDVGFQVHRIDSKSSSLTESVSARFSEMALGLGYAGTTNSIVSAGNEDGETIRLTLTQPIYNLTPETVVVRDANGRRFRFFEMEVVQGAFGEYVIDLLMEDFNNANGDISVTITNNGSAGNYLGTPFSTDLHVQFTPTGLVPVYIPLPEVVEAINMEVLD